MFHHTVVWGPRELENAHSTSTHSDVIEKQCSPQNLARRAYGGKVSMTVISMCCTAAQTGTQVLLADKHNFYPDQALV